MKSALLRWTILRPLQALHWSIPLAFIAAWLLLFVSSPCSGPPHYAAVSLLTGSLVTSVWVGWFSAPPSTIRVKVSRFFANVSYDIVSFSVWLIGLGLICAMVMPAYQCMTDRSRVIETLSLSGIYKDAVTEKAEQMGKLEGVGDGMTIEPEGRLKGGTVSRNGVIILLNEEPTALIVLRPSMSDGRIKWSCSGFPSKVLPASCRTLPTFD